MDDPNKADELPKGLPDEIERVPAKIDSLVIIKGTGSHNEFAFAIFENGAEPELSAVKLRSSALAFFPNFRRRHECNRIGPHAADQVMAPIEESSSHGPASVIGVGQK